MSKVLDMVRAFTNSEYENECKRSNLQRLHWEEQKAETEAKTAELNQRMMINLARKEGISLLELMGDPE